MPHILFMRKLIILLVMLVFAGCKQLPDIPIPTVISPYQIDIQQGNVVTQEMVAKLKPGMTRAQVRFALGSPQIVDAFRTDRWDYIYMFQRQGKPIERRNITVIFEDEKLLRLEGDVTALQPAVKPATPAAEKSAVKPPTATVPGAKPDVKQDQPQEEKGFFGRMLDKLGF